MDVYHQVLVKLYEATEGKSNKAVNLLDLAKSIGLHGNYDNILEHLNVEGWIAESVKANFVVITPNGVREARKIQSGAGSASTTRQEIVRDCNRAVHLANELAALLAAQAQNPNGDFAEATKKMIELQTSVAQIKTSLS